MNQVVNEIDDLFPCSRERVLADFRDYCDNHLSFYSKNRNFDLGNPHENVSKLSPYLRRRLVSENDVLQIALKKHSLSSLEKFIQKFLENILEGGWKCTSVLGLFKYKRRSNLPVKLE